MNPYFNRFKEIISDPINGKIRRDINSGVIENDIVHMYNGIKIHKGCYYDEFSDIFILNKGVHEPQEEYLFSLILDRIHEKNPVMIELGSYWAFYSMLFLKKFSNGKSIMIEPGKEEILSGMKNFEINDLFGEFINSHVGIDGIIIDRFIKDYAIEKLNILHSDIQGNEIDMLDGSEDSMKKALIDYFFISTHSNQIHYSCIDKLLNNNYHIISEVDLDSTYCCDGIIVASSPNLPKIVVDIGKKNESMMISDEILIKMYENINTRI
jgi:hypothetical protein